jgi:Fe-S cluster assembly protein SufD
VTTAALLPTKADEAFRYADLAALATLWPLPTQAVDVAAGESGSLSVVLAGDAPAARDLAITLGEGASYDLRLLNAGGAYGRIAVTVRLAKGRSSTWARRSLAAATRRWKSSPK